MKNQPLVPLLNLLLSLHVFLNVAGVLASSDRPSSSPLPSPLPLPLPENRASHAKIKSAVDHERPSTGDKSEVSPELFAELEELSRIADISYCVGMMGIERPFECANRCSDFDGFELVTQWNTGPLLSDSCGFVALSHPPWPKRIIIGFRGTYSLANVIADLSLTPQVYVPYNPPEEVPPGEPVRRKPECKNCSVHAGFMRSWHHARNAMMDDLETVRDVYPDYQVVCVGHSLGGAVAALAGIEMSLRGWKPRVTTFGQPRIGNRALATYVDELFDLNPKTDDRYGPVTGRSGKVGPTFHRVTHRDDPVPLLPPSEWGYLSHAGEIYLVNEKFPVDIADVRLCQGDADTNCSAGAEISPEESGRFAMLASAGEVILPSDKEESGPEEILNEDSGSSENQLPLTYANRFKVPPRYRLWQLFFAHRDYFHRLGVCLSSPSDLWSPIVNIFKQRTKWLWAHCRFRR